MKYRTEDEVRDSAKLILGFDKVEPKVKQGTGQITTFNQLGFKGVIDKPDGWYLPDDKGIPAIILETKSEAEDISLQKWAKELIKNCNIALTQYKHNGSDIGRTFYQSEPYWATDDVNVLYPKFNMSEDIALFFAPIIKCVGGLHEYDDKWKLDDMKQDAIKLPIKADGSPDFEYMETYIQKIRKSAEDRIDVLHSL